MQTISLSLILTLFISLPTRASLVEHDWLSIGDGHLTYVSELNLEILDATFTSNGHQDAILQLANNTTLSEFRFMTSQELGVIMNSILGGGLSTRNGHGDLSDIESKAASNFLNLVDAGDSDFFNTCDYALGCEIEGISSSTHVLLGGNRHILSSRFIFHNNDIDGVGTQLLVREFQVSEPSSLALFGLTVLMFFRKRYIFAKPLKIKFSNYKSLNDFS